MDNNGLARMPRKRLFKWVIFPSAPVNPAVIRLRSIREKQHQMHVPPGKFCRDASSRLTYEIHAVDQLEYPRYVSLIAKRFGLESVGNLIVGGSELFSDYTDGTTELQFAWDNWSGFIVTAKSVNSESLVRSIAVYLGHSPTTKTDFG